MKTEFVCPAVLAAMALFDGAAAAQATDAQTPTQAASEPAAETAQRIEVTAERSTLLYPYKRAYETTKKVLETGKGDVALQFRFVPTEPTLRVDDIKLKLEYEGGEERISVDAMGSFQIVPNDVAAKSDAHFVINKRRDDYKVAVDIAPNVPPRPTTVSELRRVVDNGLMVRKSLLPWYARAVMPTVGGIRICAASTGQPVSVQAPGQQPVVVPYAPSKDSPPGKPHCVDIPRSNEWPEQAVVSFPMEAGVDYYGSFF